MSLHKDDEPLIESWRSRYARLAFVVYWFDRKTRDLAGQYEIHDFDDEALARLLHYSSSADLRPQVKEISNDGVVSFGVAFGIPVDLDAFFYQLEENGFYE